jgi:predicted ATPase
MGVVLTQFAGRVTLMRDKVESFDVYPFSLPVVRTLESIDLHPKMTFLVGENGSGKSTLLEAMAVSLGFNPEGGSRNFNFSTRESHSELHRCLRIGKGVRPRDGYFLRAESWFNLGTEIEKLDAEPAPSPPIINSYGRRSLHEQSHGESFMALLNKRLGGGGLYLFDEPEAALSPARQIEALSRIHELVLQGSQFVIATHSPILMAYPDALILHCGPTGLQPIRYEDTEHFRITRDFLNHRERVMDILTAP